MTRNGFYRRYIVKITALAVIFTSLVPLTVRADIVSDIAAKQQQIQQLQAQIEQYQSQADSAGQQSKTLQGEISKLNAQISQINLQIQSLQDSIDETNLEVTQTNGAINDAQTKLAATQETLGKYLESTYENDQRSLALTVLNDDSLSSFFDYVHDLTLAQENARLSIESIKQLQDNLDQQRDVLIGKQDDLAHLKVLQQLQQQSLAGAKTTKNQILTQTKGQESKYQQLVKQGQTNLQALQQEIYYLQQSGISVTDAVKYAQAAAVGAGIRPAFLLALLEVESRLGLNVGTGNFNDDMYQCYIRLANSSKTAASRQSYLNRAETEKKAFLQITSSLGLDPAAVKVSREPSYGCGGAMGPAQFIPSTWLAYASAVTAINGHQPANPWNISDAFTAAAVKLARGGASSQTRAGEIAAAKAYIGGSPNCSQAICNSYANTILQKAATIEQNL